MSKANETSADRITERTDAVLAALRRARVNGRGYAYAVQWPQWPNHWTVEDRKPLLRAMVHGRPAQVIECREDGSWRVHSAAESDK
jgi:hypothetical protein